MNSGLILQLLNKATKIEANEIKAVLVSFSFIFTLLASYYIIRPVRDAMSSDWTDVELSAIWTVTFLMSFLVVSIYGFVCSKVKFKYLVPGGASSFNETTPAPSCPRLRCFSIIKYSLFKPTNNIIIITLNNIG